MDLSGDQGGPDSQPTITRASDGLDRMTSGPRTANPIGQIRIHSIPDLGKLLKGPARTRPPCIGKEQVMTKGGVGRIGTRAITCARCGGDATTLVIECSVVLAYLDLCEPHLDELLRGARPLALTETVRPGVGSGAGALAERVTVPRWPS